MFEIFKFYFFQIKKNIVKENSEYLRILTPFVEMNVSKLINYSFDEHVLKSPRYYSD